MNASAELEVDDDTAQLYKKEGIMMKKETILRFLLSLSLIFTGLLPGVVPGIHGVAEANATIKAFPGAEGYGAFTIGGRSSSAKVYHVTNLNDSGPGSFREAVESSGPRIVVFDVSGNISLQSTLDITHPYITIAGQTAPGDGVAIKDHAIKIRTHDVIIRGLRFRVGDLIEQIGNEPDNISLSGVSSGYEIYNIILDHNSFSWSIDENVSTYLKVKDITFQYNIMSEGLNVTYHEDPLHSMGTLFGYGAQNFSYHHNLLVHNYDRNPMVQDDARGEIINNVVYNYGYGTNITKESKTPGPAYLNIIGNYYRGDGATTAEKRANYGFRKGIRINPALPAGSQIYLYDNIDTVERPDATFDEWAIVQSTGTDPNPPTVFRADTPAVPLTDVTIEGASDARDTVLANAGAITRLDSNGKVTIARDYVDRRAVDSVVNGTGTIIDSQNEVGGWPVLASVTKPTDTDHDGMPDAFERANGLNPNRAADATSFAPSGYLWIEEYINSIIPMPEPKPTPIPQPPAGTEKLLLSQGKTATASSSESGNEPVNAVDGNMTSTRWAAGTGVYPQWWKVDLGDIYNVLQVDGYWFKSDSRAYKYKIEVSEDDITYTTVADRTDHSTYGSTSDAFSAAGRYVKVTITGSTNTSAWASAYEFRVFGSIPASEPEPEPKPGPNPPAAPPMVLFNSNFNGGNSTGWTPTAGTWEATDGAYRQSAESGGAYAYAGSASWKDYAAEATMTPVSFNGNNRFTALVVRYQDDDNFYHVNLRSNNTIELKKKVAGATTILDAKAFTVEAGEAFHIKLEAIGSTLNVYVNGNLELTAEDSTFESGKIAFHTYYATAAFDDVLVKSMGSVLDAVQSRTEGKGK